MISVPKYTDPDDFMLNGEVKYPCDTQYMKYDALRHRYYLTTEALDTNGINLELYSSQAKNKVEDFINTVTNDLYQIMQDLAPFNYRYNCYLVAQSKSIMFDRYSARKEFEEALIAQAHYKVDNLDVRLINGIDIESNQNIYYKTLRKEHRHISPIAIEKMKGLGLFFNGNIPYKNLINYKELM